jgi:hypothetical protein
MTPTLIMLNVLRAAPAVTALLGDRIHVEDAPADTDGTYALVRPSGGARTYGLARATGHQLARMTIIVFAPTFKAADETAEVIEAALEDFRNTMNGARVVIRSEGVGVSDTVDDPKRYRRAMQFDMHVSRAAPG